MGPPRFTVVQRSDDEERDELSAAPANDREPATLAESPVHELIASIEARAGEAQVPEIVAEAGLPTETGVPAALTGEQRERLRILEAMIFAAAEPVDEAKLAAHLRSVVDLAPLLAALQADYATRGVNLIKIAGKWTFRTAEDLSYVLERQTTEERRLSKAALETLSIVAYHQPVTRAEIEEVRGVSISKGTLDVLMETGWVRPRGRRRAPGKPITYGTTEAFLKHFGLDGVKDLPGLAELKGSGLLDANLPPDFKVPEPTDVAALMPDELSLDAGGDDDLQAELALDELELDEPELDDDDADGEGKPKASGA